jgi:uncharacterized membrane protein
MHTEFTQQRPPDPLAEALGWFSVALGAAELFAPITMSRLIGAPPDAKTISLVRAMGAREIGHGVAILTHPGTASTVWSRVAGDAADLAFLSAAHNAEHADRTRLLAATAAVAGVTALDVICAQRLSSRESGARMRRGDEAPPRVAKAVTVNRPIEQVFAFWRELENLPRFMRYIDSVERLGDGTSRWRARGPGGLTVEWIAEIVNERENELIAWRSLPQARVQSTGTVRFNRAPGARGTEVHVDMHFSPPGGTVGRTMAWLTGRDPARQLHADLQRFKQLLETGEIAVSEGTGLWRPGQPTGHAQKVRALAGVEP